MNKRALVISVGTGENVSHGICFSINKFRPDYILFILTPESKSKTLPLILEHSEISEYDECLLDDPNDMELITEKCEKAIRRLLEQGYKAENIGIDYTSGTKAMSLGLGYASLRLGVGSFRYVTGRRDSNGRVISGTERVLTLTPYQIYAENLFREGIEFFNRFQFSACVENAKKASQLIKIPHAQEKLQLLQKLSFAYYLWDKFELKKAHEILKNLDRKSSLFKEWGIKNRVEKNLQTLYKETQEEFCRERVADLISNAQRRAEEERFDDAVARLYRALEYIAQIKIYEKNLFKQGSTEEIVIDRLPPSLQEKYSSRKIGGLTQCYQLLADIGEDIGQEFLSEWGDKNSSLRRCLSMRNLSILAHGFVPIERSKYEEFLKECKKWAFKIIPSLDSYMEKVKFPTIKKGVSLI